MDWNENVEFLKHADYPLSPLNNNTNSSQNLTSINLTDTKRKHPTSNIKNSDQKSHLRHLISKNARLFH